MCSAQEWQHLMLGQQRLWAAGNRRLDQRAHPKGSVRAGYRRVLIAETGLALDAVDLLTRPIVADSTFHLSLTVIYYFGCAYSAGVMCIILQICHMCSPAR